MYCMTSLLQDHDDMGWEARAWVSTALAAGLGLRVAATALSASPGRKREEKASGGDGFWRRLLQALDPVH
jgi:hypothetical protein